MQPIKVKFSTNFDIQICMMNKKVATFQQMVGGHQIPSIGLGTFAVNIIFPDLIFSIEILDKKFKIIFRYKKAKLVINFDVCGLQNSYYIKNCIFNVGLVIQSISQERVARTDKQ